MSTSAALRRRAAQLGRDATTSVGGLVLSTAAVAAAGAVAVGGGWSPGATAVAAIAANLAAFGTVWIAQFVVLDRVLFGRVHAGPVTVPDRHATAFVDGRQRRAGMTTR